MWFSKEIKFDEQESMIKELIRSLLTRPKTIIEIDFTNAKFDLYNDEDKTSVAIDNLGVKVDIIKIEDNVQKIIAWDVKMTDNQLTVLKNIVAKEATIRREAHRNETFLNRIEALKETINTIISRNETPNNTERN